MPLEIALLANNRNWLAVENDGRVTANRHDIGSSETFRLFNRTHPDIDPSHGDSVVLQSSNGRFVSAMDGSGAVRAELGSIEASTILTIERQDGTGMIRPNEGVGLRTANGNFLGAAVDGSSIQADRTNRGSWETFAIMMFRPQLIRLRSMSGVYVTAEQGGDAEVTANRTSAGRWETFSLVNLMRPDRTIQTGDLIAMQTWNGKFIRTAGTNATDGRALRMTPDALFRVGTPGGGSIEHEERLTLQSLATSKYIAARAGMLVADSTTVTEEAYFTLELAERAALGFSFVPDGTALSGRPFSPLPSPMSGEYNLLTLHVYDNVATPPLTASNDQIGDAIYGSAPSLVSWLQTMSEGVLQVRNAGVFGPLQLQSVRAVYREISELLTVAETAGAPFASYAPGGLIDNRRLKLVKIGVGGAGQVHNARGISCRGIRFSGEMVGLGVSRDVDESSRMVLAHEISHLLLGARDRYGWCRPIRGDVVANRTWIGGWERFVIERVAGPGPIRSGERVMIRAHDGKHLAVGSSPPDLVANMVNTEDETAGNARIFTVAKVAGTGEISSGTKVTFRSNAGHYMTAELGGNSVVTANRTSPRRWEQFEISRLVGSGTLSSGDEVSLKSTEGFFLTAETNARDRIPPDGEPNQRDLRRGYLWDAGPGPGGNFDNTSANYTTVMLGLYDRIRLGWVRPRYLTPDNRGCYILRPFLDSREALILFDPQRPSEWYTLENRQHQEDIDEVPSSGVVISWINEEEAYWRPWFDRANDADPQVFKDLYPSVISAAAATAPPNMMALPPYWHFDMIMKRNDPNAAFTNQELVLPLGNGDPSRFHLSFHPMPEESIAVCIR